MAVSETADRKNGRSPGAGHDEWWERLMMEPSSGDPAGTGRPREKKDERQAA